VWQGSWLSADPPRWANENADCRFPSFAALILQLGAKIVCMKICFIQRETWDIFVFFLKSFSLELWGLLSAFFPCCILRWRHKCSGEEPRQSEGRKGSRASPALPVRACTQAAQEGTVITVAPSSPPPLAALDEKMLLQNRKIILEVMPLCCCCRKFCFLSVFFVRVFWEMIFVSFVYSRLEQHWWAAFGGLCSAGDRRSTGTSTALAEMHGSLCLSLALLILNYFLRISICYPMIGKVFKQGLKIPYSLGEKQLEQINRFKTCSEFAFSKWSEFSCTFGCSVHCCLLSPWWWLLCKASPAILWGERAR